MKLRTAKKVVLNSISAFWINETIGWSFDSRFFSKSSKVYRPVHKMYTVIKGCARLNRSRYKNSPYLVPTR